MSSPSSPEDDSDDVASRVRIVREGLLTGAADPDEQVAYLLHLFRLVRGYDTEDALLLDELANDVDFALEVAQGLVRDGTPLPPGVLSNLKRADALLGEWSGPDRGDFWYSSGLRAHPVWTEVRVLCRDALRALDQG